MADDTNLTSGVAGRYATALFELAQDQNALSETESELADLAKIIETSEDLTRLIRSPVIASADQAAAITAVLDKAGAGELVRNFVGVVAANRRLFVLPAMISAFRALAAKERGEISASVVSAGDLSGDQIARLKSEIEAAVGRSVNLETKTDPALLGGLVVKVGSRMVDSSLRTKLNRMKVALKEA